MILRTTEGHRAFQAWFRQKHKTMPSIGWCRVTDQQYRPEPVLFVLLIRTQCLYVWELPDERRKPWMHEPSVEPHRYGFEQSV
jgi:hypothetical protein